MKYSTALFMAALLTLATLACKQETTPKTDAGSSTVAKEEPAQTTTSPTSGSTVAADVSEMKASLQGKWKSATEPGVMYHIQGDQLERTVDGNLEKTLQLTFSPGCATNCGSIDKKYAHSGSAGCLTLSDKGSNTCFWVISYAKDQLDFVRMDKPEAKPESWVKM